MKSLLTVAAGLLVSSAVFATEPTTKTPTTEVSKAETAKDTCLKANPKLAGADLEKCIKKEESAKHGHAK